MKFKMMLVLLALVMPTYVNALGLGKLELQSALNQPFKARVKLLSATADELDSLEVSLADQEAFDRAGIQRPFLLTRLRFTVQEFEEGPDYIQIRSSDPVREPFLNFLLEINWSKGRLFREYTVLLDPPTYIAPASRQAIVHPQSPVTEIDSGDHQVVYDLDYKPEAPATISYSGSGDYGPVAAGDTLWSIASGVRPDTSVSVQQMMLAILRANPGAFIEDNINGLKRGAILQIPDTSEISSLNQADAFAQAKNQNALWDEYKGHVASYVTERPEGAVAPGQPVESSIADVEVTDEAELRLISESEQGLGSDQSSADSSGVDVDALNNELALANESIEALTSENAELKDKLTETEGIIDDQKRLIVLKEDELAAMQEQIMIAAAAQESMEEVDTEAVAEEEFVEEEAGEEVVEEEIEAEVSDAEDAIEEEIFEDVMPADVGGIGNLFGLMGLLEKAKANLMIIAGTIGGLLLLVFLMLFVSKRRDKKTTAAEISAEEFPDFGDVDSGETIALSEEVSESITDIPGSEDETILPGDESDADSFEISEASAAETLEETKSVVDEEPEEDPMEEVNVFLAYEHFDEAESFVRNALENEPDNLGFHSKLLEVFYAAGNKKAYEEAAKVVHEKTGGQGEYWDMAIVMWQEMSPNRALFETPVAGEDEEAPVDSTGGGVLNIAGDDGGSAAGDMDFDIGGDEGGEDLLDVTAAADIDSVPDNIGGSDDLDLPLDADDKPDLSADTSNELLGNTLEMQPGDVNQVLQTEEEASSEDILDVTAAIDLEEKISSVTGDEEMLDIPVVDESTGPDELDLTLDTDSPDVSPSSETQLDDSDELDISLADTSVEGEEEIPDISVVQESDDANELDISFADTSEGDSGSDELDLSLGEALDSEEKVLEKGIEEEEILDISTSGESLSSDELDLSLGESSLELDVAADISMASDEQIDDSSGLDISSGGTNEGGEDLLDVTATVNFESEGDEDLLDVTAAASAEADSDGGIVLETGSESIDFSLEDDLSGAIENGTNENEAEEVMEIDDSASLDFDLATGDEDTTDSIDLELDTPDLEIAVDTGADAGDLSIDMEVPAEKRDSLANEDNIDDDEDKTFLIPKSSDVDEQSEDDEMASQLDLAKAYIELGDHENAKTILDEIIAQGNDNYRKQAEELIGQIN